MHSAADIENDWRLQIPLYILAVRELVARARRRPLPGAGRRGSPAAWPSPARSRRDTGTTSWRSGVWGRATGRRASEPDRPADARRRGSPRSAPGNVPGRAGGATPGSPGGDVSEPAWNEGQRQAIERRLRVRVGGRGNRQDGGVGRARGAAGTGGDAARPPAGDHVHGAGGGRAQGPVRKRLRQVGHEDAAAAVDWAWISTIHGFCGRVLRAHALDAGIDPTFRVSSETEALILQGDAFARALVRFSPRRTTPASTCWRSTAAPGCAGWWGSCTSGCGESARRSSCGRSAAPTCLRRSPTWSVPRLSWAASGRRGGGRSGGGRRRPGAAARPAIRAAGKSGVNSELAEAIDLVQQAALDVHAEADRVLIEELLRLFGEEYAALKDARGLLD